MQPLTRLCNLDYVVVTATTPGDRKRVLVRAILQDKQADVGIPSDPPYVTVNP